MLTESRSGLSRVVTSLKVAALVAVLGSVVLAAEQRKAPEFVPGQAVAEAAAASQPKPVAGAQEAVADYLPAQFPETSGSAEEQPPTF